MSRLSLLPFTGISALDELSENSESSPNLAEAKLNAGVSQAVKLLHRKSFIEI